MVRFFIFDNMKKRTLYWIIFLMSISLIGIILVQWLWIENAIGVKEENYNRDVRRAMEKTAERLDKKVNFVFLSNELQERLPSPPRINEPKPDEMAREEMEKARENRLQELQEKLKEDQEHAKEKEQQIEEKMEILIRQQDSLDKHLEIDLGNLENLDSLVNISMKSLDLDSLIDVSVRSVQKSLEKVDWRTFNAEVEKQARKFNNLFKEMAYEYKYHFDSLKQRIPYTQLDSILEYQFRENGITADYTYGVYDSETDSLLYNEEHFQKEMMKNAYRVNLFPNDLVRKSIYLLVFIPEKKQQIILSMRYLLAASVLFTLVIIATFSITIHTILRQKKLSDIKSDFINNMTHEFKTPIATISVAADSIANPKTLENRDKIMNFIRIIKSENKRMNNQVERVLQMSLIDRKDYQLELQPLHAHPVIEQVVNNTRLQLDKNGGSITYDPEAEKDNVRVDEEHLLNILYNLVDNAIKYSGDYPEVTIRTKNRRNFMIISVLDSGVGIRKEELSRIFDKFYRVSTGNVHNVKGFGLGLSYVKDVVKEMKGDIKVSSQYGKGTQFDLYLPLKEENHEEA